MSETTNIEWCDATVNFWWGCTKVSPGCANCYAETLSHRFGDDIWGKGKPRRKIKGAVTLAMKLERRAIKEGRRLRVFCSSMADWLDPEVPIEWLADLLETIRQTPHLDWLLLTKRPELWRRRMMDALEYYREISEMDSRLHPMQEFIALWHSGWNCEPANVWIGTSVEDQKRADERIPHLLRIPAKVRFLSCEPLLGPVDLPIEWEEPEDGGRAYIEGIHWVIVGGESGPNARPMHPSWVRWLRDQCLSARVPFFMKQWGEWVQAYSNMDRCVEVSGLHFVKVGKQAAGRLLDGREWNEFPEGGDV